jgi:Dolichyl-phosphate-mannose-protein mannosyltransferase
MLKVGAGLLVAATAIGWRAGFRDAAGYLLLGTLCASVAVTAVAIGRRLFGWTGWADDLIRSSVIGFALIVLSGFVLGWAGLISPVAYLVLFGAIAACALRLRPAGGTPRPLDVRWLPWPVVAIAAALLAFVVGHGVTHSPLTAYDSLSYHLVFPARWLQDHRLSIIPTPFSDEAQAYAPANGELFFLWLMLPLHGDLFARVGQLPFYLLGAVTLYALARRMGARASHACYPAAFYLVARPIIEQAVGADVDLICWGMFLASLYLGIRAVDSDERRDWVIFGVSLGLCVGSKYVALVYLPIFAILALARGPRARALWALPGVAALALPWYLRNWIAGGSPI